MPEHLLADDTIARQRALLGDRVDTKPMIEVTTTPRPKSKRYRLTFKGGSL